MTIKLTVRMEMPDKEPKEFVYEFDQDMVTLGRDSNNDIQIPLTTVSRNHGRLSRDGNDWFFEDLKSTHGTSHNGKAVPSGGKKLLRTGDTLELMHFKITFAVDKDKSLTVDHAEHTEMLARRMVQEVLSNMGTGSEAPYLRVMSGPEEGKRFPLAEGVGEVVVGRGTECDFHINDANISRRHALIRKDWSGITVEDLGSKNGVSLNDKRIEKASLLKDSDEISLGSVKLVFIDPSASILSKLDDLPVFHQNQAAEEEEPQEEQASEGQVEAAPVEESPAPTDHQENPPDQDEQDGDAGEDPADLPANSGATDVLVVAALALVLLGVVALGVVVATQMR